MKVRQPLSGVTVVLAKSDAQSWLEQHESILRQELNVKAVNYTMDAGEFVTYLIQPNFQRLGKRVRGLMPKVKQRLADANGAELLQQLEQHGKVVLDFDGESVELDNEDIQVRLQANEGWAAAQGAGVVVVLSIELTQELRREGMARDVIRLVQDRRKELKLEFSDRIELALVTESNELKQAIDESSSLIQEETLALDLTNSAIPNVIQVDVNVAGNDLTIFIKVKQV